MTVKWPLYPGSLEPEHLRRYAPLGYPAIAAAHRFGYLDVPALLKLLERPGAATSEPSRLLMIFLNTATMFDRRRDIGEELDRLSAEDKSERPPLWMLLARMIIERYDDPSEALQILQDVYYTTDDPADMEPFTLYGSPPPVGENPGAAMISSLGEYLDSHGVTKSKPSDERGRF